MVLIQSDITFASISADLIVTSIYVSKQDLRFVLLLSVSFALFLISLLRRYINLKDYLIAFITCIVLLETSIYVQLQLNNWEVILGLQIRALILTIEKSKDISRKLRSVTFIGLAIYFALRTSMGLERDWTVLYNILKYLCVFSQIVFDAFTDTRYESSRVDVLKLMEMTAQRIKRFGLIVSYGNVGTSFNSNLESSTDILDNQVYLQLDQRQVIATGSNNDYKIASPLNLDNVDAIQCSYGVTFQKTTIREIFKDFLKQTNRLEERVSVNTLEDKRLDVHMLKMSDNYFYFIVEDVTKLSPEMKRHKSLTQHRRIEESKQMMKQVYKLTHDMRTPLNAIINLQKCLEQSLEGVLRDRYLKPALNCSKLLLNLVQDILDVAQIKENKIRIINNKFNLKKMMKKTLQIFELMSEQKQIRVLFNYDAEIPSRINSDKHRIRQVLINLLSNSFKYTKEHGVIQVRTIRKNSYLFEIEVQDTGIGIKPEHLDQLFREFYMVHDNADRELNPYGVGLGLTVCQEISKLLGPPGTVGMKVNSVYLKGSTFSFLVLNHDDDENLSESDGDSYELQDKVDQIAVKQKKFIQAQIFLDSKRNSKVNNNTSSLRSHQSAQLLLLQEQASQIQIKGFVKSGSNHTVKSSSFLSNKSPVDIGLKYTYNSVQRASSSVDKSMIQAFNEWADKLNGQASVLVVDDDQFNIIALQYLLESIGVKSDATGSGKSALRMFEDRVNQDCPYKIVFQDVDMGDSNGLEISTQMRKLCSTVQVIICTGYEADTLKNEMSNFGLRYFLQKPVQKSNLKQLIVQIQRQQTQ